MIHMKDLKGIDPQLKQIVTKPTRGKNILDVILTNLNDFYQEPIIVRLVQPDVSGCGASSYQRTEHF